MGGSVEAAAKSESAPRTVVPLDLDVCLSVDTGKEFSLSPLQQLHTCHAKST